ncbi:Uncharacterized protein dnm_086270 [Desulfonema magnum]|uniref:Uncharacterized protein n=1 Tax=Desulfonema magnum TaxID=45655 RepID=A0A975BWK5_9BACT|nr:Uncharacterized protein dnm_086270 [Desulfonema magnum]
MEKHWNGARLTDADIMPEWGGEYEMERRQSCCETQPQSLS